MSEPTLIWDASGLDALGHLDYSARHPTPINHWTGTAHFRNSHPNPVPTPPARDSLEWALPAEGRTRMRVSHPGQWTHVGLESQLLAMVWRKVADALFSPGAWNTTLVCGTMFRNTDYEIGEAGVRALRLADRRKRDSAAELILDAARRLRRKVLDLGLVPNILIYTHGMSTRLESAMPKEWRGLEDNVRRTVFAVHEPTYMHQPLVRPHRGQVNTQGCHAEFEKHAWVFHVAPAEGPRVGALLKIPSTEKTLLVGTTDGTDSVLETVVEAKVLDPSLGVCLKWVL